MWTRKELKERAKTAFRSNRGLCIGAGFILTLCSTGFSTSGLSDIKEFSSSGPASEAISKIEQFIRANQKEVMIAVVTISVISLLLSLFVLNPLSVGMHRFFLKNADEKASVGENASFPFNNSYGNIVKVSFSTNLFIVLLSLLLIFPGVIASYTWRMVPFILAENPGMTGTQARKMSEKMMYGNKLDAFILDLSFIGWLFIGALTFGGGNLIWTNPYKYATDAELYKTLSAGRNISS